MASNVHLKSLETTVINAACWALVCSRLLHSVLERAPVSATPMTYEERPHVLARNSTV